MKTAILLHGNVRTFFMPGRRQSRVCDDICDKFVCPNDADVFIVTEGNDFYHNGARYARRLEISNHDGFRLHNRLIKTDDAEARAILSTALESFFGDKLKKMVIEDHQDTIKDEKVEKLLSMGRIGANPVLLVKQWLKVRTGGYLINAYEQENGFKYDVILKIRFDLRFVSPAPVIFSNINYSDTQIFIPGVKGPLVYDWYAYGARDPMMFYLNLYDSLGSYSAEPVMLRECRRCGIAMAETCSSCRKADKLAISEVTLSSEYHIYQMFKEKAIRHGNGEGVYVQRYTNDSDWNTAAQSIAVSGVPVVNHTPDGGITNINH